MDFYNDYRYIIVPFFTWVAIQIFKVIWDLVTTKKFNFKRILGAGGMPSAHSAVVIALTTMIGRSQGTTSPMFGIALIFSLVVMYDATGVRREAGKQAHLLNEIINTPGLSQVQVKEKLVEALGHTPIQVFVGALVGFIIGMIF
ncbi:MAG: divergent PAP2 family protein [Christensenellales bacterium]